MTLSRLLTLSFLCLLLAQKTWCAAESNPLDPDDNDRAFEALTRKSMLGKVSDYCAQSRIINVWNECLKPFEKHANAPLASEHIQQWARRAQRAVGIEQSRMVPTRVAKLDSGYAAMAYPGSIVLDNCENYANKNCILHHEAIHIQHNDAAYIKFICISGLGTVILLYSAFIEQKITPQTYAIALTSVVGSSLAYAQWLSHHQERRADIEGSLGTQCHLCVTENSTLDRTRRAQTLATIAHLQQEAQQSPAFAQQNTLKMLQQNIQQRANYLSPDELDIIARRLKKENKVCDYHAESDSLN